MAITAGNYGIGYNAAGALLQASDSVTVDGASVTLDGAYATINAFIADCNAGATTTANLRGLIYYSDNAQSRVWTGALTTLTMNCASGTQWELRGMLGSLAGQDQVQLDSTGVGNTITSTGSTGYKYWSDLEVVNSTGNAAFFSNRGNHFLNRCYLHDNVNGVAGTGAWTGCIDCVIHSTGAGGSNTNTFIRCAVIYEGASQANRSYSASGAIIGCTFVAPNGTCMYQSHLLGATWSDSIFYGGYVYNSAFTENANSFNEALRLSMQNCCIYSTSNPGDFSPTQTVESIWGLANFSLQGNITADPLFANGSGSLNTLADIALQSGSPCLSANITARDSIIFTGQKDTPRNMGVWQSYAAPTYAAASDVRSGIDRGDGTTGTLTLPAEGKVANGIQFGGGGTEYTGNRTDAAVNTVLTGNSYGESGTEFSGNWTAATASKYQLGQTYGIGGTSETGTYDPSVTPDGQPSITSATSGNGQVTLAITAADESDVIYARYRLTGGGNWAAESETFKRTGSGTITVTGLTNNLKDGYEFSAYAKSLTVTSDWAEPVQGWATNDDFLTAREATRQRIRDDAAYAQLKIAQKLGVLVTFSNPGASDVTLYALVDSPSTKNVNVRGNAVRYSEVVFSIPRQTSFPPAAIHPSATITLNSKSYQVEQVEYEAEDISQAESVRLICGVISEQDCY